MITFEINGRKVDPRNMADELERMMLQRVEAELQEKISAIRDPETGEFPTVVVRGKNLNDLTLHLEGSPELLTLARERLGLAAEEGEEETDGVTPSPKVFLSYTEADKDKAAEIAETLEKHGIDTWFAEWCILAGDSIPQKINEGLATCTHFLVLLTPNSIEKPWVNQEMDAGLMRRLNKQCAFIPVRVGLPASALPPLLSGMSSPEVADTSNLTQLIHDIYGVSRKPSRGQAPTVVTEGKAVKTGYSPAANAIARYFVERTKHATFGEVQTTVDKLAQEVGLSVEDTEDTLYELRDFFTVSHYRVLDKDELYTEFDRHWMQWKPEEDAVKLAADMVNDPEFPSNPKEISERYGWEPRRLNPAVTYLQERGLIRNLQAMGTFPYVTAHIAANDSTRRFIKSRK